MMHLNDSAKNFMEGVPPYSVDTEPFLKIPSRGRMLHTIEGTIRPLSPFVVRVGIPADCLHGLSPNHGVPKGLMNL
ncbi:MAG: hypothetical protein A2X66_03095 [Ignavibacteria bacterium GWA2_54_16]|nr:MAG: hypothetical protein A2X66_03095 [Ignavibacteria bacterium GWA2_54_16]